MADVIEDLAAALDDHEVTNEEGQVAEGEDTPAEPAPQVTEPETPTEEPKEEPSESKTEAEPEDIREVVEDEKTGNKYVPLKRFNKIYGQSKQLERELNELKKQQEGEGIPAQGLPETPRLTTEQKLENEIMFEKYPEFDPASDKYDQDLNQVAVNIFLANKDFGMTRLEAARKAKQLAAKITEKVSGIRTEALNVKREQAESGISARATRTATQPNPDNMSLEELEAYLKQTGNWNVK